MPQTFREQVAGRLTEAFGAPANIPTTDGLLFRWILKTATGESVRLTLDSPEFPDLAHLVLSDPKSFPRVVSITMRTFDEADLVIGEIRDRLARKTPSS